ncbi:DUF4982 domain-containing protein [Microbacterium sp. kSW2-24]|uniref:glycoside hydrolase family 2 TIM barrel-domain containing protein n=1 Tax=Microbacterium galbinum TaxID=2851646 RepID=UPI001FFDA601|nr:glycoside hydrolase family 2 TIM barrel-domain containing protein [Microbacterium galbinum]MCK2022672.1 DUF4982 domain-containing protein [Microbacterium galbinum]
MTVELFTDGWTFRRDGEVDGELVRLPHDAMIGEARSAVGGTGNHGGYFPGGTYTYSKVWCVPESAVDIEYTLRFEGVYGDTRVFLDGRELGGCDSGYREFAISLGMLKGGSEATIEVHVDNSAVPNSRWYTGSGIYRPVWIEAAGPYRLAHDGIRVITRDIGAEATVEVVVGTVGDLPLGATVAVEMHGPTGSVAQRATSMSVGGTVTIPLQIEQPRPWSAEHPELYDVKVDLCIDAEVVDTRTVRTGLRTIHVDSRNGLRVNGAPVLLRGACVHHDNGILGAATFAAAEYRRARLLKQAGFNAIRSSHNPLSRAFLDACDEIGLYVMDELTDVWLKHKTPHDDADRFEASWQADADAMIASDRNHPSVIMYSIGNEIAETATADGIDAAHRLHAYFRRNDPTRPTTLAVNLLLNLMSSRGTSAFDRDQYSAAPAKAKRTTTSTAANMVTAKLGRIMNFVSRLPAADRASRDAFGSVDIAGYNYAFGRYASDRKKYPERVIVGSESMPGDLPAIWSRVLDVPGVIGDFMWTGWDYLGEAGIGVWSYGADSGSINKPFPALIAGPGALDITGVPGAPALLAAAVWGVADAPGIAVRPMDVAGRRTNRSPWRTSDAVCSWSWRGAEGTADIEVYSADDEVEVFLNGRSVGRKRTGSRSGFTARFRAEYEPGEIVAVGYRGGRESGRAMLRTAGQPVVQIRAESAETNGPDDLAFVWIELADELGTVDSMSADQITVTVTGAGSLAALGSAAPITEESFVDSTHATYRGRALAVIRGSEVGGDVVVSVQSRQHGSASTTIINSPIAAREHRKAHS